MNDSENHALVAGFIRSVKRFPNRPALYVGGKSYSYKSLGDIASTIAKTITENEPQPNPLVALLASRSRTAYSGVLGIAAAGKGYVPLNPKFPVQRLFRVFAQSGCGVLIVGGECLRILEELLALVLEPITIILPDIADAEALSSVFMRHRFIPQSLLHRGGGIIPIPQVDPQAPAYLLFTSGSTGEPKGVPVSHTNVRSYVRYVCERHQVNEHDRFSQMFDMTFDLSVHDMFVCWERGACLYSIPEKSVMAPAKFINEHQITMWFSVPSVIGIMSRLGMLSPGCFPSLRMSSFCGEPLPVSFAEIWQEAAPHSMVENLYGPTEATIGISHYLCDKVKSLSHCLNGMVPIGWIFPGHLACVIDEDRNPVALGESGELCLAGSQVTSGYWNDPSKTAEAFVSLPASGNRLWYRTGDLVRQDQSGCLYFVGRIDQQVKIRGHRVELQEIDFVLRKASGSEQTLSIPWPVRAGIAEGIAAFICGGSQANLQEILSYCKDFLPEYMVPKRILFLEEMPLNIHGKTDQSRLIRILQERGV